MVGRRLLYTFVLLAGIASHAFSQQGAIVGTLEGGVVKYHGEFSDDMFGPQGMMSLRYAALDNLWVGARLGLGEYQWKVTPSKVALYPDYFGQGSDRYPGTTVPLESRNESRVTSADVLVYYALTTSIPARPYIVAGIGGINIEPSTALSHTPLPNAQRGRYPKTISSVVVGGGVAIPITERVGLELAAEHRFVFSRYLDDIATTLGNDALTSVRIGVSYAFSTGLRQDRDDFHTREEFKLDELSIIAINYLEHCFHTDCCCCYIPHCPHCCCCCCCNGGDEGGAGASDTVKPETPSTPTAGGGPKPEPMDTPCPPGQHRECYGPPGFGICVDNLPPTGPERIRWELARTLTDGSLLREVDGKWYRKQVMPDGTTRITKGVLPFMADECKECKEKAEREARESKKNRGTTK